MIVLTAGRRLLEVRLRWIEGLNEMKMKAGKRASGRAIASGVVPSVTAGLYLLLTASAWLERE